jgi:aspartyl-tRNA(Asn)/glutamyl-tRNA(Gln) amidotransferase subunit A
MISRREFMERLAILGFSASAINSLLLGSPAEVRAQQTGKEGRLPATISEAGKRLREGSLTSVELCKSYLRCIKEFQPKLNAFITVTEEEALATAATLDAELKSGKDHGPLHGVPLVHKDNTDTRGVKTTVGSEYYANRVPQEDATIIERLRMAGAISLGKTNLNEFAAGRTGTNKFFGNIHNPWDLGRTTGGSSSGTAAAIAAGLCLGGTGTDTGSSIRTPATWCGIVGIRPTYGLVSIAGIFPRSLTLDGAGPLARCVRDVALLLDAMAGYDSRDPVSSIYQMKGSYARDLGMGVKGLRLGFIEDYTFKDVDLDVKSAVEAAGDTLAKLGAEIVTIKIPFLSGITGFPILTTVVNYEFNQILGDEFRAAKNKNAFGPLSQNSIKGGMEISKETYEKVVKERSVMIGQMKEAFKKVDALLAPGEPQVAPLLTAQPSVIARGSRFMSPVPFTRVPAICVPCGFGSEGLPIGLQIIGDHFQETLILRIAAAFEGATDFHKRNPPLYCR